MENDFEIILNDIPIECNENFVKLHFQQLYLLNNPIKSSSENQKQIIIQIDQGDNFYDLTKDIFQGNNYEITSENFNYLDKLSKIIKSAKLQTRLNSFRYKQECDDNQIDQHPSIQFLTEFSSLIRQLSLATYEDISSQIKHKFVLQDDKYTTNQENPKKSKKKKGKRKKKQEQIEEDETLENEDKNSKKPSLNKINKTSLSYLFYYDLINTLSQPFHSIEELQEHQNKIDLIIQLIKEFDSIIKKEKNEDEEEINDDDDEQNPNKEKSESYLDNFINFVVDEYKKVRKTPESNQSRTSNKNDSFLFRKRTLYNEPTTKCSDFNHKREIFYIINYLLSNELLSIEKLQTNNTIKNKPQKVDLPKYFLHHYPQQMIKKYFKDNMHLIVDENQQFETNFFRLMKVKKGNKKKKDTIECKIEEYLQNHQQRIELGFSFDDELINIVINDDLEKFKSYLQPKININSEKKLNSVLKFSKEVQFINNYKVPNQISEFCCISALRKCSLFEMASFFGSKRIFKFINKIRMNQRFKESNNIVQYMILGKDIRIINLFLYSIIKKEKTAIEDKNDENKTKNFEEEEESNDDDFYDKEIEFIDDYSNDLSNSSKKSLLVETIRKMMDSCINFNRIEIYKLLYNYLHQLNNSNETNSTINYNEIDEYMTSCVLRGYYEMIPILLEEGATTNFLLNLFCKNNNEIGIDYMLSFSYIDVNKTYEGRTPLEYCINNKNNETSFLLLNNDSIDLHNFVGDQKAKIEPRKPLLLTACQYGLYKVVDYFLQRNLYDPNIKTHEGIRPIHLACQSGNFETVSRIAQEKKKDVKITSKVSKGQFKGFTALHFACLSGNHRIVNLLLEKFKIKINQKDNIKKWTSLQYAVFNGHSKIVSILLDQPDIETDTMTAEDETLLHLACISDKADIVDMLINNPNLQNKFDLNAKTSNGRTPLQIALLNGNYDIVSLLLNIDDKKGKKKSNKKQSNIDPNIPANNGQAPLIIACEMKRNDIFNILIKHSEIDVNAQLSTGKSVLYIACELNMTEMIQKLLSFNKINVNATTKLGKTPLIAACEKGNKEAIELLIRYQNEISSSNKNNKKTKNRLIDFNAKTKGGKSSLLIACEYLRLDIAKMLLQVDEIDCNVASGDGRTPLCYACEKSSLDLVSDLIDHGANTNIHTTDNKTPLYFACLGQNVEIVSRIVSRLNDNSQINLKDSTRWKTPLFIACQSGNYDIFNILVNEMDDTDLNYQDEMGKTLLYASCEGENLEIIKTLLTQFNVNPNIPDNTGKTPLHLACEKKNAGIVDLIVNQSTISVNINEKWKDMTPLEVACEKGSFESVQVLLNQDGIQVNPTDDKEVPPLLCACEIWRTDIIKLLLTEVPDIDVDVSQSDKRRALHYACQKGDPEICDIILSKSTESINQRTTDKKTPLELACVNGNVEVISLLLRYIGDIQINAKFYDGNTVLTKACIQQSVEIVKYLLENTLIDVNATNNDNKTALFIIAENGNIQICQLLLNHNNIDVTISTKQKTPLYEATKRGYEAIVELLIDKGARPDCLTKNGKTPLHAACQHGFNKIVSILLKCPEVDVNLLTAPVNQMKTQYSPIHLACIGKASFRNDIINDLPMNFNFRSNHIKDVPSTRPFSSTSNKFSSKSNSRLCVELLMHHPQIDINIQTSKSETALTIAFNSHKFDIIQTLLQSSKIDPNVQGTSDNTALLIACQNGKIDLIRTLLNNPQTDVNCTNIDGSTPLSIACEKNNIEMIKLLLKREDLIVFKPTQENPIKKAISNNNKELFTILLNHHSYDVNELDKNHINTLGYAIEAQNIEFILQLLMISNTDVNKKSLLPDKTSTSNVSTTNNANRSSRNTASSNLAKIIGFLNRSGFGGPSMSGINSNRSGFGGPSMSGFNSNRSGFGGPSMSGINSNRSGLGGSSMSSFNSNHSVFGGPSMSGINSNLSGFGGPSMSSFNSNSTGFGFTRKTGFNATQNNTSRTQLAYLTPLSMALKIGNFQIVKLLLQSPFLKINEYANGKTALHSSIINHNMKVTTLLLTSPNVDINLITKVDPTSSTNTNDRYLMGQSALHIAIQEHDVAVVKELIQRDDLLINECTSINGNQLSTQYDSPYKNGCSALYIACSENQREIVNLLLSRPDIDLNIPSTEEGLTPLLIAAKKGYTNIVNILLSDERCDANCTAADGTNILIFACQSKNIGLLKMILSKSADSLFTSKTTDGNTPFHCVVDFNDPQILEFLFQQTRGLPFDINVRNNKGETPLHLAARINVSENLYKVRKDDKYDIEYQYIDDYKTSTVFGILLKNGADINACNLYGQTPLHYACMEQCYSNIEILLRNPKLSIEGSQEVGESTPSPFVTLIQTVLRSRSNVGARNQGINQSRLMPTISDFLDRGADYKFITEDGFSFLHFALIYRNLQFVRFFFDNIKNSNEIRSFLNLHSNYGSPIQIAIDNWNVEIMNILLKKKKEIIFNEQIKDTIIYKCALNKDTKSLILLLLNNEENIDFNVNYVSDNNEETPLHVAVNNNDLYMISILANYEQTEINSLNKSGKSPLHLACMKNEGAALAILTKIDPQTVVKMYYEDQIISKHSFYQMLINLSSSASSLNDKVNINLTTIGITRRDYFRMERERVLKLKPNTTIFNIHYNEPPYNNGFTALHISCSNRYKNAVQKILLYQNLDINAASEHGDTAVSLVCKNWNESIAQQLIDYPGVNLNYVPKEEEKDDEFDDNGNLIDKNQEAVVDPNRAPHTLTSEEMQEIKEKKMNQNKTLLHTACENHSYRIISRLLELCESGYFDINGVDSFDGMAPLHYICQDGDEQLLNLFIEFEEKNPNIINWNIKNKNGMTPLHFAVRSKQTRIVDILINNDIVCPHIDINAVATGEFENGRTPLSFACEKGLLDIVSLLLDDQSQLKKKQQNEDDPFSFKKMDSEQKTKPSTNVKRGSLCGAKNECDLSIKSKAVHQRGMTALHYACSGSNIDVVKLILKHGGFNINARANGKTCLFLACQHNRVEIVNLLLEQNEIDYNLKTPRGMTPLMIASQDGRAQIVEKLLQLRKIDKNALTVDGESARSMAKNQTIINLFDKYA